MTVMKHRFDGRETVLSEFVEKAAPGKSVLVKGHAVRKRVIEIVQDGSKGLLHSTNQIRIRHCNEEYSAGRDYSAGFGQDLIRAFFKMLYDSEGDHQIDALVRERKVPHILDLQVQLRAGAFASGKLDFSNIHSDDRFATLMQQVDELAHAAARLKNQAFCTEGFDNPI